MGYPIVSFLQLPKSLGPVELMEVPVAELVDGQGRWGSHRGKQIVVIKLGDEIRAFDGECTHLGCIVHWDSSSRSFRCPCHDGKFDDLGNPVSGPVNVPLRRVEYTIEEGVLRINDRGRTA
jgi:Rieske Fe-S protein